VFASASVLVELWIDQCAIAKSRALCVSVQHLQSREHVRLSFSVL